MNKNKRKGVVIASTLVFMTIVICFSSIIFLLIASTTIKNKIQDNKLEKYIKTQKIRLDLIENYGSVTENTTVENDYNLNIEIIVNPNNTNQKAVVVKKLSAVAKTDLYYYCIYDFDENKMLAEQTDKFYITQKDDSGTQYYFLADLIRYKEV